MNRTSSRIITLLTDFGTRDGYVAAMKGMILTIAPDARCIDAAHDIEAGDVEAAAWVLSQYWAYFPPGTVHLAVVDPGVGGDRRALALEAGGRFFVGPDNGIVTRVLESASLGPCVELSERALERQDVSRTFHGRDIFAPAAAMIASGRRLEELGAPVERPVTLPLPLPRRSESEVSGEVIYVDRFGNLITNIPADWVLGDSEFTVKRRKVGPLRASYSEVAVGTPLAIIGSARTVEIAIREGNAAGELGVGRGDAVRGRLELGD